MTRVEFELLVEQAVRSIPRRFRKRLRNVSILVEEEPSLELLRETGVEPPDTLFGLYQGTPLTERTWGYGNVLPDRIVIFQKPIERECNGVEDMRNMVAQTIIHEIGHYFGLSEDEIEAIERDYWNHRTDP